MTPDEIKEPADLKAFLLSLPHKQQKQASVVMAHRMAMRVLPLIAYGVVLSNVNLILSVFRANAISRVAGTYSSSEIAAAAATAAAAAAATADSAATAASAVFNDAGVYTATLAAADAAAAAADAADAAAVGYTDMVAVRTQNSESIRNDARILADNGLESLMLRKLWKTESASWSQMTEVLRFALGILDGQSNSDGQMWEVWWTWYEPIVDGKTPWGLPADVATTLERRIALGDNREDFWDRDPHVVTAEIYGWVEEAKLGVALAQPQGHGLRFQLLQGKISLGTFLGLHAKEDDRQRIDSNVPKLAELADLLQAELDAREAPYPPLLLKMLKRFSTLVHSDTRRIEPDDLYAASSLLRGQIESASKPDPNRNTPPLEGGELALAKSITLFSELVVLGTKRGRDLFDDADRAAKDAGPDTKFLALSKELFDLIKVQGGIMNDVAVDLLLDVLSGGALTPHPLRFGFFQEGSAKNALTVFGVLSLFAIASGSTLGMGVLAFLADKMVDVGIMVGGAYVLSKEAREAIHAFILKNETLLRKLGKEKESLKWLDDLLDIIKCQPPSGGAGK